MSDQACGGSSEELGQPYNRPEGYAGAPYSAFEPCPGEVCAYDMDIIHDTGGEQKRTLFYANGDQLDIWTAPQYADLGQHLSPYARNGAGGCPILAFHSTRSADGSTNRVYCTSRDWNSGEDTGLLWDIDADDLRAPADSLSWEREANDQSTCYYGDGSGQYIDTENRRVYINAVGAVMQNHLVPVYGWVLYDRTWSSGEGDPEFDEQGDPVYGTTYLGPYPGIPFVAMVDYRDGDVRGHVVLGGGWGWGWGGSNWFGRGFSCDGRDSPGTNDNFCEYWGFGWWGYGWGWGWWGASGPYAGYISKALYFNPGSRAWVSSSDDSWWRYWQDCQFNATDPVNTGGLFSSTVAGFRQLVESCGYGGLSYDNGSPSYSCEWRWANELGIRYDVATGGGANRFAFNPGSQVHFSPLLYKTGLQESQVFLCKWISPDDIDDFPSRVEDANGSPFEVDGGYWHWWCGRVYGIHTRDTRRRREDPETGEEVEYTPLPGAGIVRYNPDADEIVRIPNAVPNTIGNPYVFVDYSPGAKPFEELVAECLAGDCGNEEVVIGEPGCCEGDVPGVDLIWGLDFLSFFSAVKGEQVGPAQENPPSCENDDLDKLAVGLEASAGFVGTPPCPDDCVVALRIGALTGGIGSGVAQDVEFCWGQETLQRDCAFWRAGAVIIVDREDYLNGDVYISVEAVSAKGCVHNEVWNIGASN